MNMRIRSKQEILGPYLARVGEHPLKGTGGKRDKRGSGARKALWVQ